MAKDTNRPAGIENNVIVGIIAVTGLVLAGVFGLVLAGRSVDDFLTSVTLIAVPSIIALNAAISANKTRQQVTQNGEVLENVRSISNGRTDSLLTEKRQLESQLINLGHTPITHADAVSIDNKGKHSG